MLLMIIKIKMCLCNRLKENKHFCKECLVFANKGKYILYYGTCKIKKSNYSRIIRIHGSLIC